MPNKPAVPIVIRLATKTVRNGSRANDNANKTQSTKKGSHAARTMAQRLITLRTISVEIISALPASQLAFDRGNLPVHRKGLATEPRWPYVLRDPKRRAACSQELYWHSVCLSALVQKYLHKVRCPLAYGRFWLLTPNTTAATHPCPTLRNSLTPMTRRKTCCGFASAFTGSRRKRALGSTLSWTLAEMVQR